ncbi:MAG: cbb3-type cytochrome oxidase assembly protein CcoS [Desulfobacteria bacterium]|nr:cbb3-type cytochrome oxidase assembly protein CcoS [Deltaproteobacteria bacterium]
MTVWTTLLLIAVSLALGFAAWLLFLWAVKSDQYEDVERPKHRMLDDDAEKDGERTDQADPERTPAPPSNRT